MTLGASRHGSQSPPARLLGALVLAAICWHLCGGVGLAAGQRAIPSQAYDATFGLFFDGEYNHALKQYLTEGRTAIRTVQTRWIDSICYYTMSGECYYEMGELDRALECYTSALQLFCAFPDWMIRVDFGTGIRAAGPGEIVRVPWGQSRRNARIGRYPTTVLIGQGRIDQTDVIQRGGVVEQANLFPLKAQEIVRCTTLAIRRRTELMGPACPHDPLTAAVLAALSRRPGPPNHWSEAWVDLELGLALVAAGKDVQALPHLQRALAAAGEFDHPLTSVALLELGRLALTRDDYPNAATYFEEATYAAAQYFDASVLEEAFRYGALVHWLSNQKGPYPLLAPAAQWAQFKRLRAWEASLLLLAAEDQAVAGNTDQAVRLVDDARLTIGRRAMGAGQLGARLRFLLAMIRFQQKNLNEGDAALAAAMDYMKHGSHWLFQIDLADKLYTSGLIDAQQGVTARVAMDMYSTLLGDPRAADWSRRPMESLAVLVTPNLEPIEHWFEVAMARKEHEKALEIADQHRRRRFFATLPFGGRLESLRWLLEGPVEALGQESRLRRQDLLARYPAYDGLAKQARQLRAHLSEMPLVPDGQQGFQEQKKGLADLASLGLEQEADLREIAVGREPAEMVFPPLRRTADIQAALPENHALLAFFVTERRLWGFLLNNKQYSYWQVASVDVVRKRVAELLRHMGQMDANRELTAKELSGQQWKPSAQQLLRTLMEGSRADFSKPFDELIIVPDGVLWYVPFEALQVETPDGLQALGARVRIRYAPTASLAFFGGRGSKPLGNTAVVLGQLSPRGNAAAVQTAFDQLAKAVPNAAPIKDPVPAPSAVYSVLFDRLIVLDDIHPPTDGPYSWTPVQIDRGKPGNTLGEWLPLPWGGPALVVLPGYHTSAENALKRLSPQTAGDEIFFSATALLANGARTVVLSRWRTGGQSSFTLTREFVQELPHTTSADAMQRARLLVADSRIDADAEPRFKPTGEGDAPKASHPFFWAGYLLLDTGASPKNDLQEHGKE